MIIAISGPSGIGKGFVKDLLLEKYSFINELQWVTTRSLRSGESESNRLSVSQRELDELVDKGELVLVQEICGNKYGISHKALIDDSNSVIKLTELHPDNVAAALRINPNIIVIGLIPENISFLRTRLSKRNTETDIEIDAKLADAQNEITRIEQCQHLYKSILTISHRAGSNSQHFPQQRHIVSD